ncbi:hypothetical protein [Vibrio phage RYC]|nr:hypothetical protein [Vibrio phage RYC]
MDNKFKLGYYELTTEGDCEGRTTRHLGNFYGTPEQIVEHALENGLDKTYTYYLKCKDIVDVSKKQPTISVDVDRLGCISYETNEQIRLKAMRNAALSKLSDEERKVLGLGGAI